MRDTHKTFFALITLAILGISPILNAQIYYKAVKPEAVGAWHSRIQLQFLFPRK